MLNWIRARIWVKLSIAQVSFVVVIMTGIIFFNAAKQSQIITKQMVHDAEVLAESTLYGISEAISRGDNDSVKEQLKGVGENVQGVSIYISGFDGRVALSSTQQAVGARLDSLTEHPTVFDALSKMEKSDQAPSGTFEETVDGKRHLSVLRPIVNGSRCFHCHGSSRKVLGGIMVRISAEKMEAGIESIKNFNILMGVFAVVVLTCGLCFMVSLFVSRPLKVAVNMLRDIAEGEGDLTRRLEVKGKDEAGELAKWFNLFVEKVHDLAKVITTNAGTLASSSKGLSTISRQMSSGAEETSGRSNAVAAASEEMSSNMTSVARAVEQASANISIMAISAEQMTATINEIAQNSAKASTISAEAVSESRSASEKVHELGKAAKEIGKVTEAITEISEQTNLLALNATIEAARAGEAGKGFAVVAKEIKALARQTAEANGEIKKEIEGIQGSTVGTVTQIEEISKVINEVNDIVSSIATAVEEQSVTTKEIAGNVMQASQGIQEVTENVAQSSTVATEIARDMSEVNRAANEMAERSSTVNKSAEELNDMALQLKESAEKFKV